MTLRTRLTFVVALVFATGASALTPTLLDTIAFGFAGDWVWGGLAGDLKRLEGR